MRMDHERSDDMPLWMKWALTSFNRAGFPAFAFVVISYICFVTIKEQTKAIEEFKGVFTQMSSSIERNTASVEKMTNALYQTRNGK